MKTLQEINAIMDNLNDNDFNQVCDAMAHYYEKGGALRLYNIGKRIGLTNEELWRWSY